MSSPKREKKDAVVQRNGFKQKGSYLHTVRTQRNKKIKSIRGLSEENWKFHLHHLRIVQMRVEYAFIQD